MSDATSRLMVQVQAAEKAYPVTVGRGAIEELLLALDGAPVVICSDTTVMALYGGRIVDALRAAGQDPLVWTMQPGERNKNLATVESAYAALAEGRVRRDAVVVALGGGVVGDLAGFVAATYVRGLSLVQVPTTLLSQVDSSIGGKVGVDLPAGKNLVGAFHRPRAVYADPDLLASLPEQEWISGLAEVIKGGIIDDVDLLHRLEEELEEVRRRQPAQVDWLVRRAVATKARIVGEDPFEQGRRRVLNYGHTIGHAIELVTGYGTVLHGEAIAWGMVAAARLGLRLGTCDEAFVGWQSGLLRGCGLLRPLPNLDADRLVAATETDKKGGPRGLRWILPVRAGEVIEVDGIEATQVREVVAETVALAGTAAVDGGMAGPGKV